MANNYKKTLQYKKWYQETYFVNILDSVEGSEDVEKQAATIFPADLGNDDKTNQYVQSNLSYLEDDKTVLLFGQGDPNTTLNSQFNAGTIWGYKPVSDINTDYGLDEVLINKTIPDWATEIKPSMKNKGDNFGVTEQNYKNIYYVELPQDLSFQHSLKIWNITALGTSTIIRKTVNTLFFQPSIGNPARSDTVDWKGDIVSEYNDPANIDEFGSGVYEPVEQPMLLENVYHSSEYEVTGPDITLYKSPTWSLMTTDTIHENKIVLDNTVEISDYLSKYLVLGTDVVIKKLFCNKILSANTVIESINIIDKEFQINSDVTKDYTDNADFAVKRYEDISGTNTEVNSEISYDYTTNLFTFKKVDENQNETLLDLHVDYITFASGTDNSELETVSITNNTEFNDFFDGSAQSYPMPSNIKVHIYGNDTPYSLTTSRELQLSNTNNTEIIMDDNAFIDIGTTMFWIEVVGNCTNVKLKLNIIGNLNGEFFIANSGIALTNSKINLNLISCDVQNNFFEFSSPLLSHSNIFNIISDQTSFSGNNATVFSGINKSVINGIISTYSGNLLENCTDISAKLIAGGQKLNLNGDFVLF